MTLATPLWHLLIGELLVGDLLALAAPLWQLLICELLGGDLLALAAPIWQLLIGKLLGGVFDGVLEGVLVCYGGEDVDGEGVGAIHDLGSSRT